MVEKLIRLEFARGFALGVGTTRFEVPGLHLEGHAFEILEVGLAAITAVDGFAIVAVSLDPRMDSGAANPFVFPDPNKLCVLAYEKVVAGTDGRATQVLPIMWRPPVRVLTVIPFVVTLYTNNAACDILAYVLGKTVSISADDMAAILVQFPPPRE